MRADAFADKLQRKFEVGSKPARLRLVTIVSVDGGTPPTLTISIDNTNITGVRYLDSYTPVAGHDNIWAATIGESDMIILGRLAV